MPAFDAGLTALAWLGAATFPAGPAGNEVVRPADARPIAVREAPGGAIVTQLRARTPYGTPTRLWVRERHAGWEKVPAADAPGGVGWVADADTRPAPRLFRRIVIDLSASRLTVLGGGRSWSTRVVVGERSSPTPPGIYQVTDRLAGSRFNGVYGARILALSAYGTPRRTARLAVHGVPPAARPGVGSAGCVRVPDGRDRAARAGGAAGHAGQDPRLSSSSARSIRSRRSSTRSSVSWPRRRRADSTNAALIEAVITATKAIPVTITTAATSGRGCPPGPCRRSRRS